jgi:hypothetical protein
LDVLRWCGGEGSHTGGDNTGEKLAFGYRPLIGYTILSTSLLLLILPHEIASTGEILAFGYCSLIGHIILQTTPALPILPHEIASTGEMLAFRSGASPATIFSQQLHRKEDRK